MTSIRRVVCPVDFSDFSKRALDYSVAVAKWYGLPMTVLHVHPTAPVAAAPFPTIATGALQPITLDPRDRDELLKQLQVFVRIERAGSVPIECRVAEGAVATEILAEADASTLLVMGTHGRTGFEHFVLGSTTERVLRKAPGPLLTIPRPAPDATAAVPTIFHRIVAAVDFSDISMNALAEAMSLTKEADARLTLLHVIDIPDHLALWVDRNDGVSYVRKAKEAAEEQLRSAVPEDVRRHGFVDERVESGTPYREILRVAAEEHAGLIVLGAHGHDVIDRMFTGSTTQHVVRLASCPVLTFRNG